MSNYEIIDDINHLIEGIYFEKIEGYACVGDIRSNAFEHPIQYYALTNVRDCDDDAFQGVGWTPYKALFNLRKVLRRES